ncbi:hypothetical protein JYK02_34885 [Corallococcus macrosporus]|uniref:Uncharacterized protein n=1 Tax=Corallococcus macrosporus TaxID=35 RepID=A0ABS3DN43_9BACT|nr:hypothetical protein [Corallococcus macrosporus]MBN8232717.1 hypothetical protein [Corallococcus macrosporus]
MSDLYAVRVLGVTRRAVRLGVNRVHPDAGKPAPHAVFALMLMYDPIAKSGDAEFSKYRHLNDSALAQAMDERDAFDSAWMNANAQAFVSKVTRSGSFLDIQLTHPAWGEHLRKRMAWRTTAYDAGPGLPAEPRAPAGERTRVQRSQDPAAGFRVGPPRDPAFKLPGAFIPQHGPNKYVADPVISGSAAMAKVAASMIGQPLRFVPRRGQPNVGTLVMTHPKRVLFYLEGADWHLTSLFDFDELKSFGRAWLVEEDAAPASGPTAPPKRAGAKKAVRKAGARKAVKKASKVAAKKRKPTKVGSKAKKVAKAKRRA